MLNFTVGPVMASDLVLEIGREQTPYFRTPEFSRIMLENEKYMLEFSKAPENSRAVFMTCSSTGSMEAAVMNCFGREDNVLVIDGGSFGHRFVQICEIHKIPYTALVLQSGEALTKERLYEYDHKGFTGLLVNVDETSTAVLYDAEMIGEFCKRNGLFYVCDCVSSFLADPFDMEKFGADVMITGSQKAMACPPGISVIVLSPKAIGRIERTEVRSLYFDLKDALKNGERGQTPFTPAVSILLQIHARLKQIAENGGVEREVERVKELAEDFREKIKDLPLQCVSGSPANGVTAVHPLKVSAHGVFETLKDEYGIWICPNGGNLKDYLFRVGHIGDLSKEDNTVLVKALTDMQNRGLL